MKIVYCSEAGHTEEYAKILGEKLNIECIPVSKIKKLNKTDEIIYMGWVFGGNISKFKKTNSKYNIKYVVAVGMNNESKENNDLLIKTNNITVPFFYLQGGLDYTKLKGLKKKMIEMVSKQVIKENKEKDREIIEIFKNGKNCVDEKNLYKIINEINTI